MNILICDDIKNEAQKLEKALNEVSQALQQAPESIELNIRYFEKGGDLLAFVKTGVKIDVCFLDIIMPEMDGIEIARKLYEQNFSGKIVLLSNSKDYGIESYQVKAFSYLLKPFNKKNIENVLHEILEVKKNEDKAGLPVTTRNMTKFLFFHEISFVEVMRNNVYFHLLNGEDIVITAALSDVLPQLTADGRFAQCHRSYVVNMDAIMQINGKEVYLRCGRKTPISRSYKEFNDQYFMRVMGKDM